MAAAVVLSLMVMNFAILTLTTLFSPLVRKPDWLTDALFSDISTTFNFVLTGLLALALPVAGGHGLQRMQPSQGEEQMEVSRRKRWFVARVGWVGVEARC
jgi:hypothetical protein